jgi:hypothetical protein
VPIVDGSEPGFGEHVVRRQPPSRAGYLRDSFLVGQTVDVQSFELKPTAAPCRINSAVLTKSRCSATGTVAAPAIARNAAANGRSAPP